ncbi:MAG: hypothetical protein V1809_00320 [Planctomycetota bacterium]
MEIFLTSYDPSDLPGASIDPLGFERGYLFLADKILPGLTNVASRPRYIALLCAGSQLSGDQDNRSEREQILHRQETILRLERFWALANVLARPDKSGGVRGVTYAQDYLKELQRRGDTRTTAGYRLLSRQTQYGGIGMYANVADGMHFFNRDDFILTPALGEVAAEAFQEETKLPGSIRRAIIDDTDVPLTTLTDWGERAHVEAEVKPREAACLDEALNYNDVRSRMAGLLRNHPAKNAEETELDRLARVLRTLKRNGQHQDLHEGIECILAFESCYQHMQLSLERILWLCRHHTAASITLAELANDPVMLFVKTNLLARVQRLLDVLDHGTMPGFRENIDRLSDVRRFLEIASGAVQDNSSFVDAVITRHADVQHGKFDRGRRKMPWLERINSRIQLTMTRSGGMNREASQPAHISPHPYRLGAADAFISASMKDVSS